METLSFRSLLYLTMYLAWAGAAVAYAAAFARFVMPALKSRSRVALPGGAGSLEVESVATDSKRSFAGMLSWLAVGICALCLAVNFGGMVSRYYEVMHWPAQTMYEVIPMGTTAGFLSTLILYFVLGIHQRSGKARGFGDLFVAKIMVGAAWTLKYVLALDPSGRQLPPALQSAWFSTHIMAYTFGYFTLFIATLATWLYFAFKFWRGIFQRKEYPLSKGEFWMVVLSAIVLSVFGAMGMTAGIGVLALTFFIAWISQKGEDKMAWFSDWEKHADRFTWLIFVVGFPFLTAGLVQGALWAQEAWALYWGWDSKEVSALISWAFYAVYLHLRYVAGWRGERGMWVLFFGGISIFITFQLFGFLPASQSSLHRYTDMEVVPAEGMMEPPSTSAAGGTR